MHRNTGIRRTHKQTHTNHNHRRRNRRSHIRRGLHQGDKAGRHATRCRMEVRGSGAAGVLTLSEVESSSRLVVVAKGMLSVIFFAIYIFCKDVWRKHIFSVWTTGNFV